MRCLHEAGVAPSMVRRPPAYMAPLLPLEPDPYRKELAVP
jgi:hypothetical protein